MRTLPVAASLSLALLCVSVPRARACWDGHRAEVGHVVLMNGAEGETWEPVRVRETLTWLARIDALLPVGGSVLIAWTHVSVTDSTGAQHDLEWNGGSYAQLFARIARELHIDRTAQAAARRTRAEVLTVQVGAFAARDRAELLARGIDAREEGEHGAMEVGGFPSINPTAHVITLSDAGGPELHRVVVGAFVSRGEAQRVADALGGFVRPL